MNPIDLVGLMLVHFVWQGTLICAACAVLLQCLRRTSPQGRYALACAALTLMLAAPVVTGLALTNSATLIPSNIGATVMAPRHAERSLDSAPVHASQPAVGSHTETSRDIDMRSWLGVIVAVWVIG